MLRHLQQLRICKHDNILFLMKSFIDMETQTKTKLFIRPIIAICAVITFSALAGYIVLGQSRQFMRTGSTASESIVYTAYANDPTNSVTLTWTAPGDNGNTGQATSYDIRYDTQVINTGNWNLATSVPNPPTPKVAGSSESIVVIGLQPNTLYYFGLKTTDESGNPSAISNIASKQTAALSIPGCVENWTCTSWSTCANDTQTRTCTDKTSCGTTTDKPSIRQTCAGTGGSNGEDDIAPNTVITAAPTSTLTTPRFRFTWQGVDNITPADKLTFSYKLDSGTWSPCSTTKEKTYRNLDNGKHTFSVRARDAAGNFDTSPATTTFSVKLSTFTAVGIESGGTPKIRIMRNGKLQKEFLAYEPAFRGGISVSVGDLGGDGYSEVIVAPGAGRANEVRVFRTSGSLITKFYPFGATYRDGVNVSTGDVNNDGAAEIVVAKKTAAGTVRTFGFRNGRYTQIANEFNTKLKGVSLATGDLNNDGKDEVITMSATREAPTLSVYAVNNKNYKRLAFINKAYNVNLRSGYQIATGDINGDGIFEIVTVPRETATAEVRVFKLSGSTIKNLAGTFNAYGAAVRVGARISISDVNSDGKDDIGLSLGNKSKPTINYYTFTGTTAKRLPTNTLQLFSIKDRLILSHASGT